MLENFCKDDNFDLPRGRFRVIECLEDKDGLFVEWKNTSLHSLARQRKNVNSFLRHALGNGLPGFMIARIYLGAPWSPLGVTCFKRWDWAIMVQEVWH